MIVKITKENAHLYDSFFKKITESFARRNEQNPEAKKYVIRNINEYYAHIEQIAELDGRFLRLPLWDKENEEGEDYFEINANTRKIKVPDNFNSSKSREAGIAVAEDNLAEVVYFSVDRYYDRVDLYTKNIEIRWALTPTGSKNPIDSGSCAAVFIDDEALAEEGKLVFGWPITRNMAAVKGVLSFSVCFYSKLSGTERLYSLNTIPSSVNVNAGLSLENPQCTDFKEDLLKSLSNSAYTPESLTPLETPVWKFLTWETDNKPTNDVFNWEGINYSLINLDDEGKANLDAMAYSTGGGSSMNMVYSWNGSSLYDNNGTEAIEELNNSFTSENLNKSTNNGYYVIVDYKTETFEPNMCYYKVEVSEEGIETTDTHPMIQEEVKALFAAYDDALTDEEREKVTKMAKRFSRLTVSEPGIYAVHAQAEQVVHLEENGEEYDIRSQSVKIDSTSCIVPPALSLKVDDIVLVTPQIDNVPIIDEETAKDYYYVDSEVEKISVQINTPTILNLQGDAKNYYGSVAIVLNQNEEDYNAIKASFDGVEGAMYDNSAASALTYSKFYDEKGNLKPFVIENIPLVNGALMDLEGVMVHKMNKTYTLSNVFKCKYVSTVASDISVEENMGDIIAVDANNKQYKFVYAPETNPDYYISDTFGSQVPLTITVNYDNTKLTKSEKLTFTWKKLVDGEFKPLEANDDVKIDKNVIQFSADYNMTGAYQLEIKNEYHNTYRIEELPRPIYIAEVNI